MESYSVRQLNQISGHSLRTLKRIIACWLSENPPVLELPFANFKYLVADGTYLRHGNCVYTVIDYTSNLVAIYRYGVKEGYRMAMSIFDELKTSGCTPVAITVDGNTQIIKALRENWPTIIIQRCLYHILRQGTSWLRRFPKDVAARELRSIFLTVMSITNHEQRLIFTSRFANWERQYGDYVRNLDRKNKVWGDMQQARSLLIHALPDMFHYLKDPYIAKTSNKQEGLFSTVKVLFRNHRGVKTENREKYFAWYFHFRNKRIINR